MKKKQIIPVLMICALTMTACGSDKAEEQSEAVSEVVESEIESGTEADAAEAGQDENEVGVEAEVVVSEDEGEDDLKHSTTTFADATIEETELYNADGITVTATGFNAEAEFGPEIMVRVVNDSDMTVDVTAEDVTVNGYMLDPGLLYIVASPGNMVDDAITLYNFNLDARGIDTVATVSLSISVKDDETYEEIGTGERITIETSAAEGFTQSVDDSGDVIYNKDGIRVISQGLMKDDLWDGDLVLYAENDTDKYIGVTCTDISVNGQPEEYATFWVDLKPDTRAVGGMYLMDMDDLELENIDDVTEISFCLQIIDQDEWEEMDLTDEITLRFD